MKTGIQLVIGSVLYFIMMFLVFAYIPSDTFIVSAGTLAEQDFNYDPTVDQTDAANIDIFDIFEGLFSFGISGADVPWWLSLGAVYVPLFFLALGVYALIRGI